MQREAICSGRDDVTSSTLVYLYWSVNIDRNKFPLRLYLLYLKVSYWERIVLALCSQYLLIDRKQGKRWFSIRSTLSTLLLNTGLNAEAVFLFYPACMLTGETQRRALSFYQREDAKIIDFPNKIWIDLNWTSSSYSYYFLLTTVRHNIIFVKNNWKYPTIGLLKLKVAMLSLKRPNSDIHS